MNPSSTPWLDRLLIAIFLLALVLPLAFFKADPEAAAAEKRTLASPPTLPRSKADLLAFPKTFDAWFADHFGFRQAMIKTHSRLSFFVLRSSPSPKVILGKNGFIFLKGTPEEDGDPIADFRGTAPLSPYELECWRWQLEDQNAWLRDRGIAFVFAVIPGKEQMNPENMPAGYENIGRPGAYDQFVSHIAPRATYPFIDLRPALKVAAKRAITYRKTDTHWNDTGAWAGIFTLMERLRVLYPNLPKLTPSDMTYQASDYRTGDMGNMLGLPGETYEPLVDIRRKDSPVEVVPLTDHPLGDIVTTIDHPDLPRAVLFHDSFGHYLKPLLGEYFRWLRFRWSNSGIECNVVNTSNPDLVIHMMAERRIRLGQRYEMAVQQHGSRNRFEQSGQLLATWNAEAGFDGIEVPDGVVSTRQPDGLAIEGKTRLAGFIIPPIRESITHLPVIRIVCTLDDADELALSWTNRSRAFTRNIKGPIAAGRSEVYLPMLDPEAESPIAVDIVRHTDRLVIHSVDIHLVPR